MATHSSTLAWKIPWMVEPGRLQSMGSRRVGHDWATSLSLFIFMHWGRKWQHISVFLPGESQGWGAWWAAVYGVAQSRTRLKWLSSSSSSSSRIEQTKQHFPVLIFFNWWKIAHLFYFHLCFIFVLVQPVYLYPLLFFYWSFGLFSLFLCTNYLYLVC